MTPPPSRSLEDLSDNEARRLTRLGFSVALEVLRRYSNGPVPEMTRLEFIEACIREAGVRDAVAQRFTLAQCAHFLSDESSFHGYVPAGDIGDEEWLRFMIVERGCSDADLAFQIERARGGSGAPDIERIRVARERFGLLSNCGLDEADTLAILASAEPGTLGARDFLRRREWIEPRVLVRDMSDGDIAKSLARIGCPCDRSTVRLYRRNHGLRRRGYDGRNDG